jgi:hypothetical protein
MEKGIPKLFLIMLLMLISAIGCKKPYNPPATTTNYGYLVVEGLINTGADSTIIKLSRTNTIGTNAKTLNPELNATVTVEDNQGKSYPLKNAGNGNYVSPGLKASINNQYRLRILTGGKQYLSDFTQAKASPAIDSISHDYTGTAENIYSYTHDPLNNTRYYRWEYQETYLYISPVATMYHFDGTGISLLKPEGQVTTCYISDSSSHVILNSSAKLTNDIITHNPITQIPFTTDKLKIRYSILVKQYALTADAYNFYTALAKNTEDLGSIFDAQPSQLVGNIHNTSDANEPVIGYIGAGTISQMRVFIDRSQIPPTSIGVDYSYCLTSSISYHASQLDPLPQIITNGSEYPIDSIHRSLYSVKPIDSLFTITYATPQCVDCTLKGSNKKPAFWK